MMPGANETLKGIIDELEKNIEQRNQLSLHDKEIMARAKSYGFDTKVIKQVIKLRQQDPEDVEEFDMLVDAYQQALERKE